MARLKIDYGIDLGTTNSAICRMEKGEPVIIKSDTLKDTMPSCVSFNKKKSVKVGDGAYNNMQLSHGTLKHRIPILSSNAQWLQTLNMQVAIWNVILLRKNFPQKF